MKWSETTASKCRYGDVAERIWGDWNILWENSEDDYQGYAQILAEKDGIYCFYEWSYGSCSGYDTWESEDLNAEQIITEMRETALWLSNKEKLKAWLGMLEETEETPKAGNKIFAIRKQLGFKVEG